MLCGITGVPLPLSHPLAVPPWCHTTSGRGFVARHLAQGPILHAVSECRVVVVGGSYSRHSAPHPPFWSSISSLILRLYIDRHVVVLPLTTLSFAQMYPETPGECPIFCVDANNSQTYCPVTGHQFIHLIPFLFNMLQF